MVADRGRVFWDLTYVRIYSILINVTSQLFFLLPSKMEQNCLSPGIRQS